MTAHLCDGTRNEPTGDGGYFVPPIYAEEIHAQMRCQSRWLTFLRNIWRRITKHNPYLFKIKFSYISTNAPEEPDVQDKLDWLESQRYTEYTDDMNKPRYYAETMLDDLILLWAHNKALERGGDGVTYIVSPRWKELAERYSVRPDRFPERDDAADQIVFSDRQEGVTFCGTVPTYLMGQFDDALVMLK